MRSTILILKALSDKNRLRIISSLMNYDELCVCQFTELLEVSGATVSRHLSLLSNSEIIQGRKDGRWIYYRLNKENDIKDILEWIKNKINISKDILDDNKRLKNIICSYHTNNYC